MNVIRRYASGVTDILRLLKSQSFFHNRMKILNEPLQSPSEVKATDVAEKLQSLMLRLKGKYLSEDGKSVDYKGLRSDETFKEFQNQASLLCHVALKDLNDEQMKAFFINVYNILTIHGLCDIDDIPPSLLDINNFWKSTCYNINGLIFSLDDIEHGVLRANTRHPSGISKPFSESDPRRCFALSTLDPRIHFSLNCGGKSCPAISVYKENNIDKALNDATVNFLKETVKVDGKTVHLSKLFLWYGSDFGSNNKEILRWVANYLPDDRGQAITQLVESGQFSIAHDDYNWLINAA